jgi:hypothetical protein
MYCMFACLYVMQFCVVFCSVLFCSIIYYVLLCYVVPCYVMLSYVMYGAAILLLVAIISHVMQFQSFSDILTAIIF